MLDPKVRRGKSRRRIPTTRRRLCKVILVFLVSFPFDISSISSIVASFSVIAILQHHCSIAISTTICLRRSFSKHPLTERSMIVSHDSTYTKGYARIKIISTVGNVVLPCGKQIIMTSVMVATDDGRTKDNFKRFVEIHSNPYDVQYWYFASNKTAQIFRRPEICKRKRTKIS